YAMSVAFGLGYSGVMTSIAVSLRELTPVHRRGVSWGIVALFGWFGMGSGAYFGGLLHDQTQSYIVPFGAAVGAGVINVTIILGLIFTLKTRGNRPRIAPA
ncbi:MAG: MFS transporter, partial [Gammaproteobacteria bacterium]